MSSIIEYKNQPKHTFVFHGHLGEKYGTEHNFHAPTIQLCLLGILSQNKPFLEDFKQGYYTILEKNDDMEVYHTLDTIAWNINNKSRTFEIYPAIQGSGGDGSTGAGLLVAGMIILSIVLAAPTGGISLAGTAWLASGSASAAFATSIGIAAISYGLSAILYQAPTKSDDERKQNYLFNGIENYYGEASPVPLIYGYTRVGSLVIGSVLTQDDYASPFVNIPQSLSILGGGAGGGASNKPLRKDDDAPTVNYMVSDLFGEGNLLGFPETGNGKEMKYIYLDDIPTGFKDRSTGLLRYNHFFDFTYSMGNEGASYFSLAREMQEYNQVIPAIDNPQINWFYLKDIYDTSVSKIAFNLVFQGGLYWYKDNQIGQQENRFYVEFYNHKTKVWEGVKQYYYVEEQKMWDRERTAYIGDYPDPKVYVDADFSTYREGGILDTRVYRTRYESYSGINAFTGKPSGPNYGEGGLVTSNIYTIYSQTITRYTEIGGFTIKLQNRSAFQIITQFYDLGRYKDPNGILPLQIRVSALLNTENSDDPGGRQTQMSLQAVSLFRGKGFSALGRAFCNWALNSKNFPKGIPKRSYQLLGLVMPVPTTYTPPNILNPYSESNKGKYVGTWDGSFKLSWTNNPAWVLYDLLTNKRYGLARELSYVDPENPDSEPILKIDVSSFYRAAMYNDELLPDGYGGLEPRFSFNGVLDQVKPARQLLDEVATTFNAILYIESGSIVLVQDARYNNNTVRIFNPTNVIDGRFSYTGVELGAMNNSYQISYIDAKRNYEPTIIEVEDPESIETYGLKRQSVGAVGCVTRGQAYRFGRNRIYTDKYERDTISFDVSISDCDMRPLDIFEVYDPMISGLTYAGRVLEVIDDNNIRIDTNITTDKELDCKITIRYDDNTIKSFDFYQQFDKTNVINIENIGIGAAVGNVWQLQTEAVESRKFKLLTIKEDSEKQTYSILGVVHYSDKYDFIEKEIDFDIPDFTEATLELLPPTDLQFESYVELNYTGDAIAGVRLFWSPPASTAIVGYEVRYQTYFRTFIEKDEDGNDVYELDPRYISEWMPTTDCFYNIRDTGVGSMSFYVRSKGVNNTYSEPIEITVDVVSAMPPIPPVDVKSFRITASNGMVVLVWDKPKYPFRLTYGIEIDFNPDSLLPSREMQLGTNSYTIVPQFNIKDTIDFVFKIFAINENNETSPETIYASSFSLASNVVTRDFGFINFESEDYLYVKNETEEYFRNIGACKEHSRLDLNGLKYEGGYIVSESNSQASVYVDNIMYYSNTIALDITTEAPIFKYIKSTPTNKKIRLLNQKKLYTINLNPIDPNGTIFSYVDNINANILEFRVKNYKYEVNIQGLAPFVIDYPLGRALFTFVRDFITNMYSVYIDGVPFIDFNFSEFFEAITVTSNENNLELLSGQILGTTEKRENKPRGNNRDVRLFILNNGKGESISCKMNNFIIFSYVLDKEQVSSFVQNGYINNAVYSLGNYLDDGDGYDTPPEYALEGDYFLYSGRTNMYFMQGKYYKKVKDHWELIGAIDER